MLALTDNAMDVIRQAVDASGLPHGAGLRIAPDSSDSGSSFIVMLAEAPDEDDEVVDVAGARVFLDPVASPAFDDKVLDADAPAAGGVRFEVLVQDGYAEPDA